MTSHPHNRKENSITTGDWVIVCPACRVDVNGFTDPGEASYLAGIHNDLHHGHRAESYVILLDAGDSGTGPVRIGELLQEAVAYLLAKCARRASTGRGGAA